MDSFIYVSTHKSNITLMNSFPVFLNVVLPAEICRKFSDSQVQCFHRLYYMELLPSHQCQEPLEGCTLRVGQRESYNKSFLFT